MTDSKITRRKPTHLNANHPTVFLSSELNILLKHNYVTTSVPTGQNKASVMQLEA